MLQRSVESGHKLAELTRSATHKEAYNPCFQSNKSYILNHATIITGVAIQDVMKNLSSNVVFWIAIMKTEPIHNLWFHPSIGLANYFPLSGLDLKTLMSLQDEFVDDIDVFCLSQMLLVCMKEVRINDAF